MSLFVWALTVSGIRTPNGKRNYIKNSVLIPLSGLSFPVIIIHSIGGETQEIIKEIKTANSMGLLIGKEREMCLQEITMKNGTEKL